MLSPPYTKVAAQKEAVDEVARHKFRTSLKAHQAAGGNYAKHRAAFSTSKKPHGQRCAAVSDRYAKTKASPNKVVPTVGNAELPEPEDAKHTPWYKKDFDLDTVEVRGAAAVTRSCFRFVFTAMRCGTDRHTHMHTHTYTHTHAYTCIHGE